MIVLDTSVISELARPAPDPRVRAWFRHRKAGEFFTTAITEAELRYRVVILPPGRRRNELASYVDRALAKFFVGHVLAFDSDAAGAYAEIAAGRRRAGRATSVFDAQIAAIVRAHGALLATRNVRDFQDCGIELIDPWSHGA
jgi:hypothetical protein